MNKALVLGLLSVLVLGFTACNSDEDEKKNFSAPAPRVNVNRLPPGPYSQGALSIPTTVDDAFLSVMAPWSSTNAAVPYLWSYTDVGADALYPSLTLPAQEIIVAVIDTGVDKDHEDLEGRLWVNHAEYDNGVYTNGQDNDGNGYVNDYIGWDFTNNTNNPGDDSGHGSHVSGTIAAIGGNGLGIVGIAPWVRIMPLKVCDSGGVCSSSKIRAALAYAVENGAKVVNLSLGALDRGPDSLAFDAAIADAAAQGTLVVVSAGNSAIDASQMSPANARYAVAVAAHRNDGGICSFSDYGWKVDVSAPGCAVDAGQEVSGILSLHSKKCGAGGDEYCTVRRAVGEKYSLKQGTSMSAPHVAGLAAVALTASPTATPLQIRQALIRTARAAVNGSKNVDFGAGKISATNLISEAQTAPGIKITSPRYGTSSSNHSIGIRIEARAHAVIWALRYVTENNASNLNLSAGTDIATNQSVADNTSVDSTVAWAPPATGTYNLILEAEANGQKYYDVIQVSRP